MFGERAESEFGAPIGLETGQESFVIAGAGENQALGAIGKCGEGHGGFREQREQLVIR